MKHATWTDVQFILKVVDCRPSISLWLLRTDLDHAFGISYGTEYSFVVGFYFLL